MADIVDVPERNVYLENCIDEVAYCVYGRNNRRPIHDPIQFTVDGTIALCKWCEDIGLVVQDGKLCVVYNG